MEYGWITPKDAEVLEKTLDLVRFYFGEGVINVTELGVRDGKTSRGIRDYFLKTNRKYQHTGIDNQADMLIHPPFPECKLIIGSTIEVYNQLENESQHLIFIDANHSYVYTMTDFLVYSDKVKQGGYMIFHDTGKHIRPFTDYQRFGANTDPDSYISCRKAIKKLGLLDDKFEGWILVFDEADETKFTGGVTVVQKINT